MSDAARLRRCGGDLPGLSATSVRVSAATSGPRVGPRTRRRAYVLQVRDNLLTHPLASFLELRGALLDRDADARPHAEARHGEPVPAAPRASRRSSERRDLSRRRRSAAGAIVTTGPVRPRRRRTTTAPRGGGGAAPRRRASPRGADAGAARVASREDERGAKADAETHAGVDHEALQELIPFRRHDQLGRHRCWCFVLRHGWPCWSAAARAPPVRRRRAERSALATR